VSFVEGGSLLALLFVGMPLKYAFAEPSAVRVLGSVHGVLFLAFLTAGLQAVMDGSLSAARALRILAWSVAPFGFVGIDRLLRPVTRTSSPPR
jgi:integral membrane protein